MVPKIECLKKNRSFNPEIDGVTVPKNAFQNNRYFKNIDGNDKI
jgi:hypothetical protein